MDARWKNLAVFFAVVIVGWWLLQNGLPSFSSPKSAGTVSSFESGKAAIFSLLFSYDWFDPATQQIQSTNPDELQKARQDLMGLRERIQKETDFSEKKAVLGLADAWIARVDLAIAWARLRQQQSSASFSAAETNAQVCAKKFFFVQYEERLKAALQSLSKAQSFHNSFVTGFSAFAASAGFEKTMDAAFDKTGLETQLVAVQELSEACP